MEDNIKVSIVTPSFNQGQFIEETILSVLNQTYKNIEYIIVDGKSTDNTMAIVEKYRDYISTIICENDKGQSDAINKGFKLATGQLIGWINSDDILYPDCIEKIVNLYNKNPDGAIYYASELDYIDKSGNVYKKEIKKITGKDYLLNTNYDVIQQGSFYKKNTLCKVGYIDENIYYCMDLDLWIRLLEEGPVYFYEGGALAAIRSWEQTKTHLGANKFLDEILFTINKYGAKKISKAKLKLYYVKFRIAGGKIKRLLKIK